MKNMPCLFRALACTTFILLGAALRAQTPPPAPTPPLPPPPPPLAVSANPEALTHFGLRYADFEKVNITMVEAALEDPEIIAFSAQVEAMIAKRDEMIAAAACKKHPELAPKIWKMHQNITDLKQKGAARAEAMRVQRDEKPVQSVSPQG